jgi:hypothetical protein
MAKKFKRGSQDRPEEFRHAMDVFRAYNLNGRADCGYLMAYESYALKN